jgi:hypothetical protein
MTFNTSSHRPSVQYTNFCITARDAYPRPGSSIYNNMMMSDEILAEQSQLSITL